MTTDSPASGPGNAMPPPPPPPPPGAGGDSAAGRIAADLRDGTLAASRAAAPVLRQWGSRLSEWLANVTWGKFFLLSVLAIAFAAILSGLFTKEPAVVIETTPGDVKVDVQLSPHGIRVTAPQKSGATKSIEVPVAAPVPAVPAVPTAPSAPPVPPAAPEVAGAAPATAGAAAGDRAAPSVRIDDKGVHVKATKDGKAVDIVISDRGVQVKHAEAAGAGVAAAAGAGATVTAAEAAAAADPEKVAEAIETARGEIESIVRDQIDRKVARQTRQVREQSRDALVPFVMLLLVAAVIVKIAAGGRKKAETRARAASAVAAEEGLKRQLVEAQLKMMQAQVEPHFLFNTLASVDYLIETDPARASKMQKNLIQYLRAALPQMREGSTTLGKELGLVRSYLEILKVRMDERLQFAITVPQGLLSAQFPPMVLQSLVENSIKHGLEPKPEGGTLTVSADIANGQLRVTVADTGLGFDRAAPSGVGLSNIRERLAALFGGRARFTLEANAPGGTIAMVEVPYTLDTGSTQPARAADGAPQAA